MGRIILQRGWKTTREKGPFDTNEQRRHKARRVAINCLRVCVCVYAVCDKQRPSLINMYAALYLLFSLCILCYSECLYVSAHVSLRASCALDCVCIGDGPLETVCVCVWMRARRHALDCSAQHTLGYPGRGSNNQNAPAMASEEQQQRAFCVCCVLFASESTSTIFMCIVCRAYDNWIWKRECFVNSCRCRANRPKEQQK